MLVCAYCLFRRNKNVVAITVVNGNATCKGHSREALDNIRIKQ